MQKMAVWISAILIAAGSARPVERQKVILDCDLGGDIDDAFAVGLLLSSPEIEILGLVMDHGDTPGRGRIACRLLYETGMESVPVIIGRHTPVIVGVDTVPAGPSHQFSWAGGFDRIRPGKDDAAGFILAALSRYPGEVTVITVGPVCNIADLLDRDPGALRKARRVVSMFGSFFTGYDGGPVPDAEWNVRADVRSARRLLGSGADLILAGLDVTTMVRLEEADRLWVFFRRSPLTDALSGLYTLWRCESWSRPDPTLFDVAALGMVLWPDLFTTREVHAEVTETGYTVTDAARPPNCRIGVTVDKNELIRRTRDRLLHQNLERTEQAKPVTCPRP
jgi:purine nucleosidase